MLNVGTCGRRKAEGDILEKEMSLRDQKIMGEYKRFSSGRIKSRTSSQFHQYLTSSFFNTSSNRKI